MKLPSQLPEGWLTHVHACADRVLGAPKRPLVELVTEVSERYTKRRDELASTRHGDALQARTRFFLPRDVIKVLHPLRELHDAGLIPQRAWNVLDLGCGVGTTSLGAVWFAELIGGEGLNVTGVDESADACRMFSELAAQASQVAVQTRVADLRRKPSLGGPYDFVLMGLVLNELDEQEASDLVLWAAQFLTDEGALIILEPALRDPTRRLQALRDRLVDELTVFAPCLHTAPCPMLENPRDWCHEDRPFELPNELEQVARAANLRTGRSTFAYLTLRRDGRRLGTNCGAKHFRVVSSRLKSKGKLELMGCRGDGVLEKLRRLDRHASEANQAFGDAGRGDVLVRTGEGRIDVDEDVRLAVDFRLSRR